MERSMDEREIVELQDPESWDDETAEVLPPETAAKVVVPVSFTPEEFARVARFAREQGAKTSACIRDAVLDRVDQAETVQRARVRSLSHGPRTPAVIQPHEEGKVERRRVGRVRAHPGRRLLRRRRRGPGASLRPTE
jgi:hypothetical protein